MTSQTASETPPPPFLVYTPEQAAELLQLPLGTLRRWVTEGAVPCTRLGRRVRFTQANVDEILASNAKPASAAIRTGATRRVAR